MSEKRAVLGLRDNIFAHAQSVSRGDLDMGPTFIRFDRSGEPNRITLFTDERFDEVFTDASPIKIGWLIEPVDYHPSSYEAMTNPELVDRFDMVLTHYEPFVRASKRFVFIPFGGCWIYEQDWGVQPKTRNLSVIASPKRMLEGHQLRHAAIQLCGPAIDGLFGRGYNEIAYKLDGLRDFRYSLVIENARHNWFFTEKLVDAFITGTVPVYWGCPDIARFFNPDGIISFSTLDELQAILPTLTPQDYQRRLPAIHDNLERAKRYVSAEDYLYRYILEPRYGV